MLPPPLWDWAPYSSAAARDIRIESVEWFWYRMLRLLLCAFAIAACTAAADKLRIDKPDRVGRIVENQYFVADLSHRTVRGQEEDSGTLRALTYKAFGVT